MKDERGSTFMELLVVIGITTMLFTILLVSLKPKDDLRNSVTEFVSRARLAQNMSQTGQRCCAANEVPENYFIIFDLNNDAYSFQAFVGAMGDQMIQEYKLPEGIVFKDCVDDLGTVYDPCKIVWQVPDGEVYLGAQGIDLFLDVIIADPAAAETKRVRINAISGIISEM